MSNAILRIGRLDLPSIGQGDFAYIITTLGSSNFHTPGSAALPPSFPSDVPLPGLGSVLKATLTECVARIGLCKLQSGGGVIRSRRQLEGHVPERSVLVWGGEPGQEQGLVSPANLSYSPRGR